VAAFLDFFDFIADGINKVSWSIVITNTKLKYCMLCLWND